MAYFHSQIQIPILIQIPKLFLLLPPANVVCEGYVFTGVCLSTVGEGLPQCMLGDPPTRETPLNPLPGRPPLPGDHLPGRPPPGRHPCQGDPLPGRPPLAGRPPARETPHQEDTPARETPLPGRPPLQAHTQGGKLRGIRSRSTPKGGN